MKEKISVIMPSLNVAPYIRECMESVLHQSLHEFEIVCVDAGSDDGTREILNSYAEVDQRVNIVESAVRSYGYQVNLGLRYASGEYISIVETDDYIASDMFQTLYSIAKEKNVDVVKGDSVAFFVNKTGKRWEHVRHIFSGSNEKLYGLILRSGAFKELHSLDINLWNGIYRREFLLRENIRLNESSGAAFQDIGFVQQVLSRAENITYLRDIVYYYRLDREESSINQAGWLKFLCQEYQYLFGNVTASPEKMYQGHGKWICKRFAEAFVCELRKTILLDGKDTRSWISDYFVLQSLFQKLLSDKVLGRQDFEGPFWKDFRLALTSISSYRDVVCLDDRLRQEFFLQELADAQFNKIIIFGCGAWGKELAEELFKRDIRVLAICDNDIALRGTDYQGIPIVDAENALSMNPQGGWLIASKMHAEEMRNQLLGMGVLESRILKYMPV